MKAGDLHERLEPEQVLIVTLPCWSEPPAKYVPLGVEYDGESYNENRGRAVFIEYAPGRFCQAIGGTVVARANAVRKLRAEACRDQP